MAIYEAINDELEGEDIRKIAKDMVLEINNFGFDKKKVVENITGDGVYVAIDMALWSVGLLYKAYESGNYDARNEKACRVAKELSDYLPDWIWQAICKKTYKRFVNEPDTVNPACYMAYFMSEQHRTLQQTWAGLMFEILLTYDKELCDKLPESLKDDMRHLPMI